MNTELVINKPFTINHSHFCKKEKEGRGYLLFEKLRDVKEKRVGEKLTVATQNGEIDLFW